MRHTPGLLGVNYNGTSFAGARAFDIWTTVIRTSKRSVIDFEQRYEPRSGLLPRTRRLRP